MCVVRIEININVIFTYVVGGVHEAYSHEAYAGTTRPIPTRPTHMSPKVQPGTTRPTDCQFRLLNWNVVSRHTHTNTHTHTHTVYDFIIFVGSRNCASYVLRFLHRQNVVVVDFLFCRY